MWRDFSNIVASITIAAALVGSAGATSIPRLSFEQLTDVSNMVVAGHIARSWSAWDAEHKYIWTHYELSVDSAHKGGPPSKVEFAEPGGTVGGFVMAIAGSVAYTPGENVFVFLQEMPNGYLRTTGWGQGKYTLDPDGTLHGDAALRGVDIVDTKTPAAAATPLTRLEGMNIKDAGARIATRVRLTESRGRTN